MKRKKKDSKVVKLKTPFVGKNLIHIKKLIFFGCVVTICFVLLLCRIGYLQFVQGNWLKELAYKQQTINQIISPKRGNIYDSTGNSLAISAQVNTVTINPNKIELKTTEQTKALKETVAKGLSDIFELDYNETLEKVNSSAQVETIVKKVEQEKIDELTKWMSENNVTVGINIDEDSKRYYPNNNVASHVLGFCGSDNQGLTGIEAKWDSVLTGTPGKIVSYKSGSQDEIPNTEEKYIAAQNGSDLTLTIDLNIQRILEQHLKQAVDNNKCLRGGNVIAMNPKTGDILGMASYPDYNLNDPFTPNEQLAKTYDTLSSEDKVTALNEMWRSKSISELYEPGSVFKVITSSVALEENVTQSDVANDFNCNLVETFEDGTQITCWSDHPHGSQTLRQALENSCNPAFMQLGKRIGASTLYKYYDAFGFLNKTGIDIEGETNSIFTPLDQIGPVELATMSFGQRVVNITPIQMITAISAVANDGVLMKPRIVKSYTNSDTKAVTEIPTSAVRQVISKETSNKVKSLMESVATEGTGKTAAVKGYSIGGKTGTSEPRPGKEEEGYVASYVAISPIEDTQITLLLTLYQPTAGSHQGGTIAGPVVSQMLTEILPYLGVPSDTDQITANTSTDNLIMVPDIRNKTVTEAKKVLQAAGLDSKISVEGDPNTVLVQDQIPKPGISLQKGSVVVLYSTENTVRTSNITVPDLAGMTLAEATNTLKTKNLNITFEGTGVVTSQDYSKDTMVEEGTVIHVVLKQTIENAQ